MLEQSLNVKQGQEANDNKVYLRMENHDMTEEEKEAVLRYLVAAFVVYLDDYVVSNNLALVIEAKG